MGLQGLTYAEKALKVKQGRFVLYTVNRFVRHWGIRERVAHVDMYGYWI